MNISAFIQKTLKDIETTVSLQDIEDLRISLFGKKGALTQLLKDLGGKSLEERKELGAALNDTKDCLKKALDGRKTYLEDCELNKKLEEEIIDVSLPPRPLVQGRIHPLSRALDEAIHIFSRMGFSVAEGPDVEDDFHNFTALNISSSHPARQEQDTFYLTSKAGELPPVLRTHTSPVQIRTMIHQKPPLRIIAPGRTYRSDHDSTHTPMFHQIEGLVVDEHTHMGHLKGCLEEFFKFFFKDPALKLRFRPAYFPFTEPSAEVDIWWKNERWLEVLGCGMVHPNVLQNCGIDPTVYQGYAFGMGLERITMLKYGIEDLRLFFDSDLRWLAHYGFKPGARV